MTRIDTESVVAAYEATGLVPLRAHAYVKDGGCCALGSIHCQRGIKRAVYDWANAWLGQSYVSGFLEGFDGQRNQRRRNGRERQGFRDGQAAAKAVADKYGEF